MQLYALVDISLGDMVQQFILNLNKKWFFISAFGGIQDEGCTTSFH